MALTTAQINEHIGAAMRAALDAPSVRAAANPDALSAYVVAAAKIYRLTGTAGTLAERTEAMHAFLLDACEVICRVDSSRVNHFRTWLETALPGEGAVYA